VPVLNHRILRRDGRVCGLIANLHRNLVDGRYWAKFLLAVQYLSAFAQRPAVIAAALDDVDGFKRAVAHRVGNQPGVCRI